LELDFVLGTTLSGSLNDGATQLFSDTVPINLAEPLLVFGGGEFSGSLDAGPLNVSLAAPTLPSISQSATIGSPANLSGAGNEFISADLNISKIITDATGGEVPLAAEGSVAGIDYEGDILGINLDAGLPLTQTVQFTPSISVTLTSADGQTQTGALGQSFNFTMPASADSINIFKIGPLWAKTLYSASGNLINLYQVPAFSLSTSPSIAPLSTITNAIQVSALNGAPAPTAQEVASVSPGTLDASTSPQLLQIFGSGFTPSSTLLFSVDGQQILSASSNLQYISSTEIDYMLAVGSTPAAWTVAVVTSGVTSNACGFNVVQPSINTTPPTAYLSSPSTGSSVSQAALDASRYLSVTYSDFASGINPSTITNGTPKFTLTGQGVGTATISNDSVILVSGTTYEYPFTGSFATGQVDVNFLSGTFADNAGNLNVETTQTFTVTSSQPTSGAVSMTISPQSAISAGAQWAVLGDNYVSSGSSVGLNPGTYTLTFKPISGYTTPQNQTVTVTAGATTPVTAAYAQQSGPYNLLILSNNGNVFTNPSASLYAAGTPVTLTVVPNTRYHFTGRSGDASGSQNPLTITMNSNMSITANYAVGDLTRGSLQVNLGPTTAVASGAQWEIDGGSWMSSGSTVSGIVGGAGIGLLPAGNRLYDACESICDNYRWAANRDHGAIHAAGPNRKSSGRHHAARGSCGRSGMECGRRHYLVQQWSDGSESFRRQPYRSIQAYNRLGDAWKPDGPNRRWTNYAGDRPIQPACGCAADFIPLAECWIDCRRVASYDSGIGFCRSSVGDVRRYHRHERDGH
jgi:hypothetical protein